MTSFANYIKSRASCFVLECPIQNHPNHRLVSLAESIEDSEELAQLKRDIATEQSCLKVYAEKIKESKDIMVKESEEARKALDRKVDEIIVHAEKLKLQIEEKSNEEQEMLENIFGNVETYVSIGQQIGHEIDTRPKSILSESVQTLTDIMDQYVSFRQASFQQRSTALKSR